MSKRGVRQIVFVCSSISNQGELINKIIPAESQDDASKLFFEQFSIKPKEILGPFYKKRAQVLENTRTLKFSNKTMKAIYNDWEVTAFLLNEPEKYAYLVFNKCSGNKPVPKGTVVVPISDLRFIDVK